VAQNLSTIVGGATPGLNAGALATLRDVGITMDQGGRLKLDEAMLDTRLLGRLGEVRRVFEFTTTASSSALTVYAHSNALTDQAFTVAISDPDADGVPDSATIDGVAADISGGTIQGLDGTPYEGLKLIWTGKGDATIDLRVSPGVADRLYHAVDAALDRADGPLERAIAQLGDANQGFRQQIDRIGERADRARERLVARFSAMESALSLANTMLTQIRSQMDAMNGQN
jgi:flagellar hook-associated protein 2